MYFLVMSPSSCDFIMMLLSVYNGITYIYSSLTYEYLDFRWWTVNLFQLFAYTQQKLHI